MSLRAFVDSESPPTQAASYEDQAHNRSLNSTNGGRSQPLEKVVIITVDGRTLIGTLLSCDQVTNLVLQDTIERVIRPADGDEPSLEQPHGVYMVRGDNVVVCGLVDEELDASIDWTKVRGEAIRSTKNV